VKFGLTLGKLSQPYNHKIDVYCRIMLKSNWILQRDSQLPHILLTPQSVRWKVKVTMPVICPLFTRTIICYNEHRLFSQININQTQQLTHRKQVAKCLPIQCTQLHYIPSLNSVETPLTEFYRYIWNVSNSMSFSSHLLTPSINIIKHHLLQLNGFWSVFRSIKLEKIYSYVSFKWLA
jgi:hypothetical protein